MEEQIVVSIPRQMLTCDICFDPIKDPAGGYFFIYILLIFKNILFICLFFIYL